MSVDQFLHHHQLEFPRFTHEAAYTCEQFDALALNLSGARNKNLFLQDKKGRRHFLVLTSPDHQVDLTALSSTLGVKKLGLASEDRLARYLGVESGSVSILALINDVEKKVELVVDEAIWKAKAIQAHPLVNTETVIIEAEGLQRFLSLTGHKAIVIEVPRL
jgi:Ala-tRNA(Pro) deacylase